MAGSPVSAGRVRARGRFADVLLAGAMGRSGLAAARSLSRRGIPFVAVGHEPKGMVARSRHVRDYVTAPWPGDEPQAFFDVVLDTCAKRGVRLVIPLIDPSLATCSDHREDLPEGVKLAAPSAAAVRNVLDKRENLETARRLGIRCPGEFTLEDVDQLQELIEKLGFPMVLKNTGLARGESHPAHAFKWRIARDERELRALLDELVANGRYPLFQELVDGQITNLCCFAVSGKVVAVHEYRSLRRLGWAGNGVLREIAAPTPGLIDQAERLLGDLQWEGAAHVGFVVRRSDGASWYMETNGRFWGSIEGSIAIGWDFPYWTYRYFTHGDLPAPPSLEIGSRACWHFGDLNLLWKRLQGTEPPVPPGPPKLHAIAEYLAGFAPGVHSDVFALDDPLPSLVEHWEWISPALARGLHRLR